VSLFQVYFLKNTNYHSLINLALSCQFSNASGSCMNLNFNVGNNSCNAEGSCVNLQFNVGNNSCNRSDGCNGCQQQQGMFNVSHMV